MATIVLLNNFMHDFSAAGWIFCSVQLFMVFRNGLESRQQTDASIGMLKTVLLLMKLSLAGIVLFGAVRVLAYKSFEWSEAAGDAQITVLVIKHIFLTGVFIWGLRLFIITGRWIKKTEHE